MNPLFRKAIKMFKMQTQSTAGVYIVENAKIKYG